MAYMQPLIIFIDMEGTLKFPFKSDAFQYLNTLFLVSPMHFCHLYKVYSFLLFPPFGSAHTDCIIAEDQEVVDAFLGQVDRLECIPLL